MNGKARAGQSRGRAIAGFWLAAVKRTSSTAAAILEIAIRLSLAQAFFVSGMMLKAMNWDSALYFAAHEYPVVWGDPTTAAYLGVSVELICPIFLGIGFLTRLAAIPLLILSLVIQFHYRELDMHLFWAALLARCVILGAGPLSVDSRIARGLGQSAVPVAAFAIRLTTALSRLGGPAYQLALRAWLSAGLAWLSLSPKFFPVATAHELARPLALTCAALIGIGLATPIASATVIVILIGRGMMGLSDSLWLDALAVFAFAGAFGAGPLSLDYLILRAAQSHLLPETNRLLPETAPHIVIVGAGFAGLACAKKLRDLPARITLIDQRNYHLFQPLLYQVATAALSPGDIATPIRSVFRDAPNVRVLRGAVSGVDIVGSTVRLNEQSIAYDYLILATGASHSYFGQNQWAPFAPGLKRLEDAIDVRRRILDAFERAEAIEAATERMRLLTFLIVGGGPTGVELAGAVAELAHHGFEEEFRQFDPASTRILLVQSGPRILPTFPEQLSFRATKSLESLGVEVLLNSRVEAIDDTGVTFNGSRVDAATVLWAAGVVASPAAQWLGADADKAGRVKVADDLSVPGLPNIFVIGDTAAANSWGGNPVPGLAPAAKQGGLYVASVIRARILGRKAPPPFQYRHMGSLATIGRKSAVADFGGLRLSGAGAWWLWGAVHVFFLIGLRNRLSIMFDWFWAYITYDVGTRLITGDERGRSVD
jgi:NADH dehydrogenase/putative oxidoreductase